MPLRIKAAILAVALVLSLAGWKSLHALFLSQSGPTAKHANGETTMSRKIQKTETEWKNSLGPERFSVMRECGTEPPFSGIYNLHFEKGAYLCAACGAPLFSSASKYDHGTGWPSFSAAIDESRLEFVEDRSLVIPRIEVRCASCGSHLGHLFDDGPGPSFEHYCINSAALGFKPQDQGDSASTKARQAAGPAARPTVQPETATFAAGCFWGVEYKFGRLKGVMATRVGYTGGTTPGPDYEQVCTDGTGHAEAIRLEFDPSRISYEELVRFFFTMHDPTEVNRQGPDVGSQYRSLIFYHSQAQKDAAAKVMSELAGSGRYIKPIATGLVPASEFYPAEEYHQKYYDKSNKGACAY